ncbi:uroporphyrinogen decarboxylase [Brackiella oedipodis]|uniref:uroporphyrinogen decarboxylase n=1 Tax=Brackiella oedipodis TaxID=124225 RepID=UPI00048EA9B0|nr:uroporphyrinogen decarboxylase [Brackiella oedipodis]
MSAELKNDVFLRALQRQAVPYTPVWLMRQAGRYLPEYKATRAQAGSFMGLAQHPEFATEVTLQPIDRYALDAAILFADILLIPDAMGLGLHFVTGEGPQFERPIQTAQAAAQLQVPDMNKLKYVFDAVSMIRRELDGRVPLIGFAGSPFTVACYMVEGASSKDYRTIKAMLYKTPQLLHQILNVTAQTTALYLNEQIKAGAQAVMIFDSWGGVLAHGVYQEFSLAYMRAVMEQLERQHNGQTIPVILFTKGGGLWIEDMAKSGADALGLDWTMSLAKARQLTADKVALQGNLDPMALLGSEQSLRAEVRRVLDDFGQVGAGGHVFNLGHGINQFVDPEQVQVLVDEVHSYSRQFHQ